MKVIAVNPRSSGSHKNSEKLGRRHEKRLPVNPHVNIISLIVVGAPQMCLDGPCYDDKWKSDDNGDDMKDVHQKMIVDVCGCAANKCCATRDNKLLSTLLLLDANEGYTAMEFADGDN